MQVPRNVPPTNDSRTELKSSDMSNRSPTKNIARKTARGSIRGDVIVNPSPIKLRVDWVAGLKNSITQKGCDATTNVSMRPKKPAKKREPLSFNYTDQTDPAVLS